jgi:hypothetical protein
MLTESNPITHMPSSHRMAFPRRAPSRQKGWRPEAGLCALAAAVAFVAMASPAWASFGIETFKASVVDREGSPATQAGSHPYAMTTTIVFNHHAVEENDIAPDGNPKNIAVNLPAGLIANPTATETSCIEAELEKGVCPNGSAVGVVTIDAGSLAFNGNEEQTAPLFSMVPPPGVPAEFGFNAAGVGIIVHILGKVRTGGDYGLSAEVSNILQADSVYGTVLTLWGDPSDASHDKERGSCVVEKTFVEEGGSCPTERTDRPLLTLPSSCTGESLRETMSAGSWQEPDSPPVTASAQLPAVSGCEAVDFSPRLTVEPEPEAVTGDSPSGLRVDLHLPQEESSGGLAEANLKDAVVTLPVGMTISPAVAGGLGACTPEEIGLSNAEQPSCPDSSRVGSVEIVTPLLATPLEGSIYLAQQNDNPFGSLLALYLVAEGSGALIKLAGHVEADVNTGQLTTRFEGNPPLQGEPPLPFSDLRLEFFGGPRAALATPSGCGTYTVTSKLTPYSSTVPAEPSSSFTIGSGCGGGFDPSFSAGTTNNQAGGYSPLLATLGRDDGEQDLSGITVRMSPGLIAKIAGVPLCGEPQAQAGECPETSKIGVVSVAAGPGTAPYWITGRAYLTGPYGGAPYGLSVVVPTQAGPFNLGEEVVRAAIGIDPHTAAVTIVSGPLPTIKDGIPFQIKEIEIDANREGFVLNPTDCEALRVEATVAGAPPIGSSEAPRSVQVSSPFAVSGCRNLPFKPSFAVSTRGRASIRGNGASLTVKVAQRTGEANIHSVRVELPKKLPSRLSTLNGACTEATFNANPASCPATSDVGTAVADTPVLPAPLTGPAYFVSHGGAKFPELVVVLQGDGVTIELDGETHIDSKTGITSSTFGSMPDAPIGSFELSLPERPNSALASVTGNLCGKSLTMPTTIIGQNGARVTQATHVSVTGCPKHRARSGRRKAKK